MAEGEDTNGAATLLAIHTAMAWLTERELQRDPAAKDALLAFTEARMARLVRAYPDLLGAAQAACGVVAREADSAPNVVRLHA
ncbi:hypothetical protein G3T14_21375 [Methylobacterium sp. BTF04]|uniref:hypothetical protein n=1 Tax=Methylobacterium sp. BTF04 TaxID=2708300 RepID=UPI0013D627CD|nr:hypothetical protein [Methylobacterium sp. BTF04]NEU14638.1 hypothetical protein [Methylobacterium sp. BTF04]